MGMMMLTGGHDDADRSAPMIRWVGMTLPIDRHDDADAPDHDADRSAWSSDASASLADRSACRSRGVGEADRRAGMYSPIARRGDAGRSARQSMHGLSPGGVASQIDAK
jgi:hypothetical protein